MKLSIILPIFNERLYLSEIFRRIMTTRLNPEVSSIEILAVDDGSTDGSREWLSETEKGFSTRFKSSSGLPTFMKTLFLPKNSGKGAAVRAGIEASTGDVILIQDADLEYHPKDYPSLLAPILANQADAVFGSRFVGGGSSGHRRVLYFWNAVVNRVLNLLFNFLANMTCTDIGTGYKALKGPLARSLRLKSNRFGFEPEISARLAKARIRLFEVGISYYGRTYAEGKKIGPFDAIAAVFHIIRFTLFGGSPYHAGLLQTLSALENASDQLYCESLRDLIRFLPKKGRLKILEVGSGIGSITQELIKHGSVVASDLSDEYTGMLRERFGFVDDFKSVQWDATAAIESAATPEEVRSGHFDLIVAFNVVEHLPHADQVIQRWRSLLSAEGAMMLLVPFSQRLYTPIDRAVGHVKRYTRPELENLLESCGAQVIQSRYANPLGILGWILNGKILGRDTLPQGQIKLYSFLKPFIKPIEKPLNRYIGLSIISLAKLPTGRQQPPSQSDFSASSPG